MGGRKSPHSGKSVQGLAEALAVQPGVHRTYMSSIERGKVDVSVTVAAQVAAASGVPLSVLIWDAVKLQTSKRPSGR